MPNNRYREVMSSPEQRLTDRQRRWLRQRGVAARMAYILAYHFNRCLVRVTFRLTIVGSQYLPVAGPVVLMPNHTSPLDPPVLAATLPLELLQRTYWAGKQSTVLRNPLRRFLSWVTRVIPIENEPCALACAVTILDQGNGLIWFPEGKRSLDGQLQTFKRGIGALLTQCDVPVVPVYISGTHAAFPAAASLPRLGTRIVVRIGRPVSASQLGLASVTSENIARAVETLRQCVVELREEQIADDEHQL